MVVTTDLQYFNNYNYYKKLLLASDINFDISGRYQKNSFCNRCEIAGANGKIVLTVPLVGGRNQRTLMKEILICNEENWQLRHWKSIVSSYNSSPWFNYYTDELAAIYNRPFNFLKDWNLVCTEWIFRKLNFHPVMTVTAENLKALPFAAECIDLRTVSDPAKLQAPDSLVYQQVFADKLGFIPGLSILDLMFCEGPVRTVNLLR